MNLNNVRGYIKEFCRQYIIAPALWNSLAEIAGYIRRNPSYLNKQKRQYPYCWVGQDFDVGRGGEYFPRTLRDQLKLITRNSESKAASLIASDEAYLISGFPFNTSHLIFAVTTVKPHVHAKDLIVKINGNEVNCIRGELMREAWQHIRVSVPEGVSKLEVAFSWSGGGLYLADPVAEFPSPVRDEIKAQDIDTADVRVSLEAKRPNIIVLVLDSLMAPIVGCLNGVEQHLSLTPNIDRYFESGRLFSNAYSVSEYTMPSLATMATGLYPIEHGVFTHDRNQRELPSNIPTLAETMRANGYRTLGYSTGARFSPLYAHYRGYDRFFYHQMSHGKTADLQVDRAIEFMEAHQGSPAFCFLHMIDPHPPFPLPTYYSDVLSEGRVRWGDSRSLYSAFKLHQDSRDLVHDLRAVEKIMIRNLDMILARLFAWLEYTGRGKSTNVVLLADHGREYRKCNPLFTKNLTHVPFLIGGVGVSPSFQDEFSEAPLDLYPTIMGLANISAPSHLSGLDMSVSNLPRRKICTSESLFKRTGEIVLRSNDWVYGLRCDFDYMNGEFNFEDKKGEWLHRRNPTTYKEYFEKNYLLEEPSLAEEFRALARQHYNNRKRRFNNASILDFSKEYPE